MSIYRRNLLLNNYKNLDKYILNVTSVSPSPFDGDNLDTVLSFSISTGNRGCYVICGGQTRFIGPNIENATYTLEYDNTITDDIIFCGTILKVASIEIEVGSDDYRAGWIINEIVKWPSYNKATYAQQFAHQTLSYDIIIPENIKDLINLPFYSAAFPNSSNKGQLILHNNIENIEALHQNPYANSTSQCFANAVLENDIFSINNIAVETRYAYGNTTKKEYIMPSNIKRIANFLFANFSLIWSGYTHVASVILNEGLEEIGEKAFYACSGLTTITIPSTVKKIKDLAWARTDGSMNISSVTFNQVANMQVELPTAGYSTGMFYVKTAREMTIYTDNETIKNYNWSADNITATILHLDGTAWEV